MIVGHASSEAEKLVIAFEASDLSEGASLQKIQLAFEAHHFKLERGEGAALKLVEDKTDNAFADAAEAITALNHQLVQISNIIGLLDELRGLDKTKPFK